MQSRAKIWQKYYDTCAALNDKVFQTARFDVPKFQYRAIIKDIRKKLKLNRENLLLDIGCANGMIDKTISMYTKRIIGLDNSFDVSLLYGVTMHFEAEDIKKIVAEMINVTKNKGLIFIGDNITEYQNKNRKKRNRWNKFKAYTQLNPENKSIIWLRVLIFLVLKKIVLTLRKSLYKLQNKARSVPDPFPNIPYSEESMLEMITELGQVGQILKQNYKLPYALDRYDILIQVQK
ncbi:MAG: hypothetical protein P8X73_11425 [Ignavibacteriaceae bacterium]